MGWRTWLRVCQLQAGTQQRGSGPLVRTAGVGTKRRLKGYGESVGRPVRGCSRAVGTPVPRSPASAGSAGRGHRKTTLRNNTLMSNAHRPQENSTCFASPDRKFKKISSRMIVRRFPHDVFFTATFTSAIQARFVPWGKPSLGFFIDTSESDLLLLTLLVTILVFPILR